MMEPLKKTLLAGLGVVSFTKEKLEGALHEMVERGELTRDQGKNVLKVLLNRGDVEGKNIIDRISKETERWLARGPLATHGELRALERRVVELESRLGVEPTDQQDGKDPAASASSLDSSAASA